MGHICLVHARSRGAETWWKSFTTGKSAETLGGIPHDVYGMTSLSIRQFVLGLYKQLGLRERDVTKVQTGGPGVSFPHRIAILFITQFSRRRPWLQCAFCLIGL